MQRFIMYCCILACCLSLKAQTYFKAAGNVSWFETANVEAKPGFSLALGHQWHIYKGFGLGGEFRLSQRKTYVKNKTFKTGNFDPKYDDIYYTNYQIFKKSIDIPLYINKKINSKGVHFLLSVVYSITLDVKSEDGIKVIGTKPYKSLSEEEQKLFEFDYESIGDLELIGSGHESIEIGLSINIYKQYFIHCIFVRSYIKRIDGIFFKEYMSTIALGAGLNF